MFNCIVIQFFKLHTMIPAFVIKTIGIFCKQTHFSCIGNKIISWNVTIFKTIEALGVNTYYTNKKKNRIDQYQFQRIFVDW